MYSFRPDRPNSGLAQSRNAKPRQIVHGGLCLAGGSEESPAIGLRENLSLSSSMISGPLCSMIPAP